MVKPIRDFCKTIQVRLLKNSVQWKGHQAYIFGNLFHDTQCPIWCQANGQDVQNYKANLSIRYMRNQ